MPYPRLFFQLIRVSARSRWSNLCHLLVRLHTFWTPRRTLVAGVSALLLVLAAYSVAFHWPRTLQFSYSGENCMANPTFLPELTAKKHSDTFSLEQTPSLSVAGYPLYSHQTCVSATNAPRAGSEEKLSLTMPGNFLTEKSITVKSGSLPVITPLASTTTPISTKDPLQFTLETADGVFEYRLAANGAQSTCDLRAQTLSCDTLPLKLAQGAHYSFELERLFRGKRISTVYSQSLTTVEPIQVVGTSISAGQLVYNSPSEVVFTLNKPASSFKTVSLEQITGGTRRSLAITTSADGNNLVVRFSDALPRSASLVVSIGDIRSVDGSYLAAPLTLPFQTSGGPKVKGISIGTYKVQPGGNIVLTFDVALAPDQRAADFIHIDSGGPVSATVTAQGNRVTISPTAVGRCIPFTVIVSDGLKSEFGITGDSAWQFKARTICQTTFSIGSSVQGRSITGYRFGSGVNKIVFVGGTHGDERSSVQILNRWIDQLEANPSRIPAHQTIIVIPSINPDGYAANRRTNSNNVDLNRNFPANNWKSGVTMPDKSYLEYGGGVAPLSEPESSALANYVLSQSPRLVLTYHAAGSVVVPNGSADSDPIAVQYGKKSIVGYMSPAQTGTFFEYDTTGAFEDWLHDKHGIPALLIELASRTSNDYSGHQDALWYIAGL